MALLLLFIFFSVTIALFCLERGSILDICVVLAGWGFCVVAFNQLMDEHELLVNRLFAFDAGLNSIRFSFDLLWNGKVIFFWLNDAWLGLHSLVLADA